MTGYVAGAAVNLGVGQQTQVTAGNETTLTSAAIAVGRDGAQDAVVCIFNQSGEQLTVQAAAVDADANYLPLYGTDGSMALTVANGVAAMIKVIGPFIRFLYTQAPTGPVTVAR